jgi:alkylhydroperoxidase family enzyme
VTVRLDGRHEPAQISPDRSIATNEREIHQQSLYWNRRRSYRRHRPEQTAKEERTLAVNGYVASVPQVDELALGDPELIDIVERAAITPTPQWYRTMGNSPEVAKAFAGYWDLLHRGGSVPHEIKELARIQIAQMIGCEFCARQVSPLAASNTEEEKRSCALPNWEHSDPKTRAALHYARTLTLDDGRDEEVYGELREHYTLAEIVELASFFCLTMGGNRMAKSWGIEPHLGDVIPDGVMSVHACV